MFAGLQFDRAFDVARCMKASPNPQDSPTRGRQQEAALRDNLTEHPNGRRHLEKYLGPRNRTFYERLGVDFG